MKSNFIKPLRFHSWISTKQYQKQVTETKGAKIPNGILKKKAIFTDDFLGLQQSLCNMNSSLGILKGKYYAMIDLPSNW